MLVERFLKIITEVEQLHVKWLDDVKVSITPEEGFEWLIPEITIKDINDLEEALLEYLDTIMRSDLKSTKTDAKHDEDYFLWILIKNLCNTDCDEFCEYVKKQTQFFHDETFSEYSTVTSLGELDDGYSIEVKRSEEYYGTETPFVMVFYKKNNHIKYEMPLIRYGIYQDSISGQRVARIYSIQQKKLYGEGNALIASVKSSFSSVNSGIKKFRDVPPTMVACFATFCGLLYSRKIYDIEIVDFIPRRYLRFRDAETDEEKDRIQSSATDKFIKTALRVAQSLNGVEVIAYPNDIDSNLHIRLDERIIQNSLQTSNTTNQYLMLGLKSIENQKTL